MSEASIQTLPAAIRVSDDRARRILIELEAALSKLSAAELATIVLAKGSSDFVSSLVRRGVNIAKLVGSIHEATQREAINGALAWKAGREEFDSHINQRVSSGFSKVRNIGDKLLTAVGKRGCKNFCVNGQLAGNCCTAMEMQINDRHERIDRQPAG